MFSQDLNLEVCNVGATVVICGSVRRGFLRMGLIQAEQTVEWRRFQ